jgi:hypothetical protein
MLYQFIVAGADVPKMPGVLSTLKEILFLLWSNSVYFAVFLKILLLL